MQIHEFKKGCRVPRNLWVLKAFRWCNVRNPSTRFIFGTCILSVPQAEFVKNKQKSVNDELNCFLSGNMRLISNFS